MKRFICAMLSMILLLACAACGEAPGAQVSQPGNSPAPSQEAAPSPSVTITPTPVPEVSPAPEETTIPEPSPEPEPTAAVDPSSKLLPNIFTFLYHDRSYITDGGHGRKISCNGSHPGASFEAARDELLALLAEEKYQLEMVDSWINPHYSGIEMYDYFYVYTGSAEEIKTLTDKYEEHEFHVMLRMTYYPEYDYFKLSIYYSNTFDVVDPGTRTLWDIEHNGAGGLLTAPPEGSSGSSSSGVPDSGNTFTPEASRLDCLTCRGDGDCNTCGGDGYTGFGSAKAGCRTCHGNGKCRACGGSGKR